MKRYSVDISCKQMGDPESNVIGVSVSISVNAESSERAIEKAAEVARSLIAGRNVTINNNAEVIHSPPAFLEGTIEEVDISGKPPGTIPP